MLGAVSQMALCVAGQALQVGSVRYNSQYTNSESTGFMMNR